MLAIWRRWAGCRASDRTTEGRGPPLLNRAFVTRSIGDRQGNRAVPTAARVGLLFPLRIGRMPLDPRCKPRGAVRQGEGRREALRRFQLSRGHCARSARRRLSRWNPARRRAVRLLQLIGWEDDRVCDGADLGGRTCRPDWLRGACSRALSVDGGPDPRLFGGGERFGSAQRVVPIVHRGDPSPERRAISAQRSAWDGGPVDPSGQPAVGSGGEFRAALDC